MTSSNTLLKQLLASYRQRKRIQALLLCLAMLVSMLTMVSLKHSGVAVTMDDAEPVLGEAAVSDMTEREEPDSQTGDSASELPALQQEAGTDSAEDEEISAEPSPAGAAAEIAGADTETDDNPGAPAAAETETTDDDAEAEEAGAEEEARAMPAAVFEGSVGDLVVRAEAPEGAFPEGTSMKLSAVEDQAALNSIRGAVDQQVVRVCAVDISFLDAEGNEIEPLRPIRVEIVPAVKEKTNPCTVVHLDNAGEASVVDQDDDTDQVGAVSFHTDSFSIYAVVYTIEKTVLASDGQNYHISVTCGDESGVPENAELSVEEISEDSPEYREYAEKAENALGWKNGAVSYLRLFDIKIVDADGAKVEISAPVEVAIELEQRRSGAETVVLHFADGADEPDVIRNVAVDGDTLSFAAESFSAYAIVSGPEAIPANWLKVSSLDELASQGAVGVYIGHTNGFYLMDETGTISGSRTGIKKTKPAQGYPADAAAMYYFEPAGTANTYYIYCLDGSTRKYIRNTGNNSLSFTTSTSQRTAFTAEAGTVSGSFTFRNGSWFINMQGGNNGDYFAAYNAVGDVNNNMYLWYSDTAGQNDPYRLDGKTYGIINWNGGAAGKAMMATAVNAPNALDALALTVMTNSGDDEDKLFVPSDTDISFWTFHWVSGENYYLTAEVDGSTKYLRLDASGATMVSIPDDNCELKVIPGTGAHEGQICLRNGNTTLTYSGELANGFSVGGATGSEWMNFVELSELTSDYFRVFSAQKVSVSDTNVTNGSKIIVYTRIWNEAKKGYEFFAVGPDGTLVPCYESGDSIQWLGNQMNTLLWNFVEYYWEGTTTPNNYYELYNEYSEHFVAPQVTDGQILSDNVIGLNMTGRQNGAYYTTILAWDDEHYSYAGLKVENGQVVSCPWSEADDFYFAVIEDLVVDDHLTTVNTVDHTQYGITMKIKNFGTRAEMSNFLGNDDGGAVVVTQPNLLSTNLDANGYPTAAGGSLADFFTGAAEVNHLFIENTYYGSGYFEFDSAQNYASLDGTDFTVYKELGTHDTSSRPTLKHGQFFPFNEIEPGVFASVNGKNLYSTTGQLLPDSDPRKNEQLYLIKNPDYYFGVELEASFVQTPNGKDAWGHDIIYEFTGDDDFWLYVDGELIIDLGGIHSALPGSVNYSTGDVYVNGRHYTLRELFAKNYRTRNPGATPAQVDAYLAEYFEEGSTVFKDYSSHTMRIFYFERGAGASNLHMRFNLAAIRPGTVELSKELANVDTTESILAEFAYQIRYTTEADPVPQLLTQPENNPNVLYKDTITPVKFMPSVTIDGIVYENVFILKPGEIAEITFPEEILNYTITECGVNTDVYRGVSVNGTAVAGTEIPGHNDRKDFRIDPASTKDRPRVVYANEVNPNALRTLTVTKKLFAENGTTQISHDQDTSVFTFRLYLGTEFETDLSPANLHTYHVLDPAGNYCRWNAADQKFVSLGKTNYASLTDAEKQAATFNASINGSVSKIPVDYTVQIREVLAGTRYGVEERDGEIPDGYSRQQYILYDDINDSGPSYTSETVPPNGNIVVDKDPHVDVCNLKGWGLRVNKVWTDEDYMAERDATYFAVFVREENDDPTAYDNLSVVEGSIRRMTRSQNTLYWYFLPLPVNVPFDRYEIYEVTVENPTVDEDGKVTDCDSVTPIENGHEVQIVGKQKGETESSEFTYMVLYERGTQGENSNVRVDQVTNNRPGIVLSKEDWNGNALAGAAFTLTDSSGNLIGTFTSDENGQITVAFLRDDVDYTLTETGTPQGYHGLEEDMTILLHEGTLTVDYPDVDYYEVTQESGGMPSLTVKNCPCSFEAVKKNADTGAPMEGVPFALHRQVTVDGVTNFDVNPMPGYEDLVTDENGLIPGLDVNLPAGVYQLREKETPEGYQKLEDYIYFTVSPTGNITLNAHPDGVTLTGPPAQDGHIRYILTVPNVPLRKLSFKKVNIANPESSALEGAQFDLYRVTDGEREEPALISGLISGADGMLAKDGTRVFELTTGVYHLVETEAPDGYNLKADPVVITVTADGVSYDEGTSLSSGGNGLAYQESTRVYTLKISNSAGYVLPNTGGTGTQPYTLGGLALMLLSAATGILRRRRKRIREPL